MTDAAELEALEAIIHPAVGAARRAFLARHRAHAMVLLDIPLLFETRAERSMDLVVVVSAPLFLQRRPKISRISATKSHPQLHHLQPQRYSHQVLPSFSLWVYD